MTLSEQILDFIKSDKLYEEINLKNDSIKLFKEQKENNISFLYIDDNNSSFLSKYKYIGTFKDGKCLHFNETLNIDLSDLDLSKSTTEEIFNINNPEDNIDFKEIFIKFMNKTYNSESFIKNASERSKEDAKSKAKHIVFYNDNHEKETNRILDYQLNYYIDKDVILGYLLKNKSLLNKAFARFWAENESLIETYFLIKKYIKEIKDEPLYETKTKIAKAVKDLEEKEEINIVYTELDGSIKKVSKKMTHVNFAFNINDGIFLDIPIISIKELSIKDKLIYEMKEDFSKEEKLNALLKLIKSKRFKIEIPTSAYNDKFFLTQIIKENLRYADKIPKKFYKDTDLLVEISNIIIEKDGIISEFMPVDIFENKDFLDALADNLIENNKKANFLYFFNYIDANKLNIEEIKKYYSALDNMARITFLDKIDEKILNSEEFYKFIKKDFKNNKEPYIPFKESLAKKIKSEELLSLFFNPKTLINSFDELNDYHKTNKDFIIFLINQIKEQRINPYGMHGVLEYYQNNDLIIDNLAKIMSGSTSDFLNFANIRNQKRISELASLNITFLSELNENETKEFIENSICSYEYFTYIKTGEDKYELRLFTDYNTIVIKDSSITIIDNNTNCTNFYDIEDINLNLFIEEYNNRNPKKTYKDFEDFTKTNKEKLKRENIIAER